MISSVVFKLSGGAGSVFSTGGREEIKRWRGTWPTVGTVEMALRNMPPSGLVTLPTLSLQDLETRNVELEHQLRVTERSLEEARAERERARAEVGRAAQLLDVRLFELSELREGLARLAEGAP